MRNYPVFAIAVVVATSSLVGSVQERPFERPLVSGRQLMVTSDNPLATMAGFRVLMEGGNAFDAAIATAVAIGVVDPRMASIGGHGFATMYVARSHEVRALNFYGDAPRGATPARYAGQDYSIGYLSAPVPSSLKGFAALHAAHGKLAWARVLAPAIELADQGFAMYGWLSESIRARRDELSRFPSTAKVFLPEGRVPEPGEIFRQPDLARTLRTIAINGADAFYGGTLPRKIGTFFQEHGGVLSAEDIEAYQARWVTPISTTYRGYAVYTQPPSSSGIAVLEQLNILEGFDLPSLERNSDAYLHLIGEVMRLAIADRNRYVADPNFVAVPVDRLLSKEYAAERRSLIRVDHTMPVSVAGDYAQPEESHTTHLNVADGDGNLVALTQTLGALFGSGVIAADTGVLFSDEMRHLHLDPQAPSYLQPGKRSRSNQSPIIVLKDEKPFLAVGSPGNDGIWQRLVQVLVNVIDYHLDVQRAVSEPRMVYGGNQETATELRPIFNVEDRIAATIMDGLRARGYQVKAVETDNGLVTAIMIDPRSGLRLGGADPREASYAVGW
jgi:gamma-glutamyltranspeptidase / glutathione hydrolase